MAFLIRFVADQTRPDIGGGAFGFPRLFYVPERMVCRCERMNCVARGVFDSPGMVRSACLREGSTKVLCMGRTVVRYWWVTDSGVRPRSVISRLRRRVRRMSASASTNILRLKRLQSWVFSNKIMPSTMMMGCGSRVMVWECRVCDVKS